MKVRFIAIMEHDLELEIDDFELPDDIDKNDEEEVREHLMEVARETDGGLFTEIEGGGGWRIYDVEIVEEKAS